MLLNVPQYTGQPTSKNYSAPTITSVMTEKLECRLVILAAKCST